MVTSCGASDVGGSSTVCSDASPESVDAALGARPFFFGGIERE